MNSDKIVRARSIDKKITSITVLLLTVALPHVSDVRPACAQSKDRVMLGVRFIGANTRKPEDDTAVIAMVIPGGPAEIAGIRVGDEILSIGESVILQPPDSIAALKGRDPGDTVRIEVMRGDEFMFFDVELVVATRGNELPPGDAEGGTPIRMSGGLLGEKAPEWTVTEWSGLPEGKEDLTLGELSGRIVYLFCFQAACEMSRRQALPVLRDVKAHFEADDSIVFVAIQTAFEAYAANTMNSAKRLFGSRGVDVPIGQDGEEGRESQTLKSYGEGDTPWIVIIGPDGIIKYNGFNLTTEQAIDIINRIKNANGQSTDGD